uniref:zinc ribbon domain-containing protein n=1 Tax=Pseudactinotalea sp. TaxID=1926260 RepID=UPI003B3B3D40
DQLKLLDVQALDQRLAKLAHQRRSHPSLAALEEVTARADDLDRARVDAETAVRDARRAVTKAETDVEQVSNRAARDRQRLESGTGSPKDLQALGHELESLAKRQSDLEEVELEAMEVLETAQGELDAISTQRSALGEQITQLETERDAAFAEIDAEKATVEQQRASAVEPLDQGLVTLYERVRERSGGLGVLRLRGSTTDPLQISLSLTELAAIEAAPAEEIVRSEDGYIIVRVTD